MTIHVVRTGETLAAIAEHYGVDPARLAADNTVSGGQLAVGQTLVVRFSRQVHAVRAGETLSSIARDYRLAAKRLFGRDRSWSSLILRKSWVPPFSTATPTLIFLQRCWRNSSPI